jgi:hypothetical protein
MDLAAAVQTTPGLTILTALATPFPLHRTIVAYFVFMYGILYATKFRIFMFFTSGCYCRQANPGIAYVIIDMLGSQPKNFVDFAVVVSLVVLIACVIAGPSN